jgi:hypothetical protein
MHGSGITRSCGVTGHALMLKCMVTKGDIKQPKTSSKAVAKAENVKK